MEKDEEFVPLQEQQVFGAGIMRKRVPFVAASTDSSLSTTPRSSNIGERYLSIVLQDARLVKGDKLPKEIPSEQMEAVTEGHIEAVKPEDSAERALCEICKLPMEYTNRTTFSNSRPHEASLAHQVCLVHSYPPSHLDRTRKGLQYLSSYGWDPDSRLGLGVAGEGIRVPIKAKPKINTVGIGAEKIFHTQKPSEKKQKLDAKQVRQNEQEARRKRAKLQELFYRNDDVEKYLETV